MLKKAANSVDGLFREKQSSEVQETGKRAGNQLSGPMITSPTSKQREGNSILQPRL